MLIDLSPEQCDEIVVSSLQTFMIDLLDDVGDEREDMIFNVYAVLYYYMTEEDLHEFMSEYPEIAEICEWEIE